MTAPLRANDPATRREQLLFLLRSRTQAEPLWSLDELGHALCCTPRTVQRYLSWLRENGYLPPA